MGPMRTVMEVLVLAGFWDVAVDPTPALLCEGIRAVLRPGVTEVEFQAVANRLLSLSA